MGDNLDDEYFEDFAKKYPDLIAKSGQEYLGVGAGWYHILDALFSRMSYRIENARMRLKYSLENPSANMGQTIEELEKEVADALEELPTILQIKEKFGALRIYVNHATPEIQNYISFAESMSSRCCEVCGSPGKMYNDGWIRTMCEKHLKEEQDRNG